MAMNNGGIVAGARVTQQMLTVYMERHVDFLNGVRDGRKILLRRCDLSGLDHSMTPTLKVRRHRIVQTYGQALRDLY